MMIDDPLVCEATELLSSDCAVQDVEISEPEVSEDVPREKKGGSAQLFSFLEEFEKLSSSEEKIRASIVFMRGALEKRAAFRFRDFWEGKKACLPLFKENLQPKVRSELWQAYVELSAEARSLKEILDEQSAFAVEQIELAIQAIERDLEHYDTALLHAASVEFPLESEILRKKLSTYLELQKELQLLNMLASRISGLRKEVMKTQMRIKVKNKLFERLSSCGDQVFPRRKDLIKMISDAFQEDIEEFVKSYFGEQSEERVPFHLLRQEIKALQSIAKILTLNTQSFGQTRLKLSGCWDQLKEKEKDKRKEISDKRQEFKQNFDKVLEKITAFAQECEKEISWNDANAQADAILSFMRGVELGKEEVRSLKQQLIVAKLPIEEKEFQKKEERRLKTIEEDLLRRKRIDSLKEQLEALFIGSEDLGSCELTEKRGELFKEFEALQLNKIEKQIIERQFRQVKDRISEKKGRELMVLSEDDLKSLEQLQSVLKERKERRLEIKEQLEGYRKALGGSGFDFEKAMMYRELIEAEKASLDKVNASIEEIEEKIAEIEG
ncbi:MAG: hypothetical protein HYZ48_04345 [Chlamydiales bacterium]|nr:hypothetical protein [Chlamydiales bacterium]